MCLAIPAKVLNVEGDKAMVDLDGVQMPISLALVDDVVAGDYVVVHVGYALSRIDPTEAEIQLKLMRDAIAEDVGQ